MLTNRIRWHLVGKGKSVYWVNSSSARAVKAKAKAKLQVKV